MTYQIVGGETKTITST